MIPWKPGDPALSLEPIGVIRTAFAEKVDAPRQPRAEDDSRGRIELFSGHDFEHALEDLEGWEYLWVIFWFHLNDAWRPKVLPPRSTTGRKGVFSTRAPHRPNPLGLSAVRLERVEGLTLHVSGVDMVDGTPVLDLKPYVPYTDAHPDARCGWLDDAGRDTPGTAPEDPLPAWQVEFESLALRQAAWVEAHTGLALRERVAAALALGPKPNPYRRIRPEGEFFRLSVKEWRVLFLVDGRRIRVMRVSSGYRPTQLAGEEAATDAAIATHRRFVQCWPG